MMSIDRILKLAGLTEARQIDDPDDESDREDAMSEREARIRNLIGSVFTRLGVEIAEHHGMRAIFYSESDREAQVTLDDNQIDLDVLMRLKTTGLSDRYTITAARDSNNLPVIEIVFQVGPELDHAVMR